MLDEVTIFVRAGRGGNGALHFRREKFVPHGGPDGGDGGDGGNVLAEASAQVRTLAVFHHRERCVAESGGAGGGRGKTGRRGEDLLLAVPVGTVVSCLGRGGEALQREDLGRPGARLMLARGGRGGWGNRRFATATNQEPRLAEAGEEPEEGGVKFELKLVADVGVVGLPNAGKSSLLRAASSARPKVAGYPFTTLEPELAVVEWRGGDFVMVEIPGLIEGAHLGVGLGHQFLRHAERTRLLLYLVDGSSLDMGGAYSQVRGEVAAYSQDMAGQPQVVAVNKIDIPGVRARMPEIEAALADAPGPVFFISAVTGEGVATLMDRLREGLAGLPPRTDGGQGPPLQLRGKPRRPRPGRVVRQGQHRFLVQWPKAERLASLANLEDGLVRAQLLHQLRRLGVAQALTTAGAQPGDTVRIGKAELEWTG